MMESTSRRSLSLNLDLSDLFVGSSYFPMSKFVASQKAFRGTGLKSSTEYTSQAYNEMSHFLNMDDSKSDVKVSSKNSNIFRSMMNAFSSFTNAVSKIPNYMTNINNTLSVTIVPNGGIISSEYILKNLTQKKEHLSRCMEPSTNILECVKNKTLQKNMPSTKMKVSNMQHVNTDLNEKLMNIGSILSKTCLGIVHNPPQTSIQYIEHSNAIYNIPISESIACNLDELNNLLSSEININMEENKMLNCLPTKIHEKTTETMSQFVQNSYDDETESLKTQFNDIVNCKESMKKPFPPGGKSWKKNIITRTRGKGRGKVQLRKSGVSQLKHRKKRSKQNLFCNIQDNIDDWNEKEHNLNIFSEHCVNPESSPRVINHFYDDGNITKSQKINPDCHTLTRIYPLLDEPMSTRRMVTKTLSNPVPSSNESITCDFRNRNMSDSSIESEDSCFIVFEDKSESECTSEHDDWLSEEESENDENDNWDHKVRFTLEPTIHVMFKWDFAYRAARRGPWEEIARDRERFRSRINCVGKVLDPILMVLHREQIYKNRFATKTGQSQIDHMQFYES